MRIVPHSGIFTNQQVPLLAELTNATIDKLLEVNGLTFSDDLAKANKHDPD